MFGLEGSGFMISIAMTFFLVGLVMYYVRQRFNDQEKQLNQMVSIIPVMSQQLQIHESILKNNQSSLPGQQGATSQDSVNTTRNTLYGIPEEHEKINVSDNDVEESDTESEDTDESDEDSDEHEDNVKNISLGGDVPDITVADIEAELGNQLQAMAMQGGIGQVRLVSVHTMDGDQRDSLVDNPHNIELIDDNDNMTEQPDSKSESDSESDTDSASEEDENTPSEVTIDATALDEVTVLTDMSPEESKPSETTKVIKNDSMSVDYSKMAVAALRETVVSQGLADASDVSKLKKKRLLELLK